VSEVRVKALGGFRVRGSGFGVQEKRGADLLLQFVGWVYSPTFSPPKCKVGEYTHPTNCRSSPWHFIWDSSFVKDAARVFITMVCVVCAVIFLIGCGRDSESKTDTRPVIVATIFPLQSIVEQLTGDWADVELLMPPGSNPHNFELQPAQMAPLSRADVLVAVGLNLDGWAERAAQQVARKDLRVIRMTGSTPAEVTRSLARNPHLWMDPAYTKDFVGTLGEALAGQYPAHANDITAKTRALQQEQATMDADFRRQLAAVPVKEYVAYHNAYDPLATRYGLRAVAHLTQIELAPGGEVSPQDLVAALDAIRLHHLRVIYAEPQFPARATEVLREEAGVQVLSLDDLGGPSIAGYDSYQAMLKSDVNALVEGQSIKP
jgi:zinc transport system substrate-binding protein